VYAIPGHIHAFGNLFTSIFCCNIHITQSYTKLFKWNNKPIFVLLWLQSGLGVP
jgi:hypothetical protein